MAAAITARRAEVAAVTFLPTARRKLIDLGKPK
ncbi:hypothetical protein FHS42_000307 [Streptomyces zagrosensis]|uniref:Uncharacterized protein n=1 Tax=Streptomyces zagrosensis TaxID=1042984 RepID=A0A7W9Q461_9ACTN|nr:hypothetical protein [Streptomyces zagrosensis]